MSTSPAPQFLCQLDDIPDGGARGFALSQSERSLDIIVVRQGRTLAGYINSCPHLGTPLEIFPDRFLTRDGRHLLCHTHGALFTLDAGDCIAGPCKGDRLPPVPLELRDDGQVLAWPPSDS
ncbi:Rieske (2Fe-2S) protein [Fodinicurvata halophila]|uniref:Rieske (2Fe-2S) protein n=1 Tax=Fodinicurvata halophila TaxID=1419723 RepID=A0ABV8ULJ4_9PROT